jgi:hypothetical protein
MIFLLIRLGLSRRGICNRRAKLLIRVRKLKLERRSAMRCRDASRNVLFLRQTPYARCPKVGQLAKRDVDNVKKIDRQ